MTGVHLQRSTLQHNINPVMADMVRVDGKNFTVTKLDDLTIQVVNRRFSRRFWRRSARVC